MSFWGCLEDLCLPVCNCKSLLLLYIFEPVLLCTLDLLQFELLRLSAMIQGNESFCTFLGCCMFCTCSSCCASVQMFELLGAKEFLPQRRAASDLYGKMCIQTPTFCLQAIEAICGYNDANINMTRLPLYLTYTPAGQLLPSFHKSDMLCGCLTVQSSTFGCLPA